MKRSCLMFECWTNSLLALFASGASGQTPPISFGLFEAITCCRRSRVFDLISRDPHFAPSKAHDR